MKLVSTFTKRLNEAMQGRQPIDLANAIGMSKQAVSAYMLGKRNPKQPTIKAIAEYLGVSPIWLLGYDVDKVPKPAVSTNIIPLPPMTKIPLIGSIACGKPILAVENIEEYVDMPQDIRATFALRCKGDSMTGARVYDGDIVYIHAQPDVENGEIAAVQIMDIDCEVTLKRVKKTGNTVVLMPENPAYDPIVFVGDEINKLRILGKAVAFTSLIR